MANKPPNCSMCDKRQLIPIPRSDGTPSSFVGCLNCDSPTGVVPQLTDPT